MSAGPVGRSAAVAESQDDYERQLQDALRLSMQTYKHEERRRSSSSANCAQAAVGDGDAATVASSDLIHFVDPGQMEREKKIEDIKRLSLIQHLRTSPLNGETSSSMPQKHNSSYFFAPCSSVISGGTRAYGMTKTYSAPNFDPPFRTFSTPNPSSVSTQPTSEAAPAPILPGPRSKTSVGALDKPRIQLNPPPVHQHSTALKQFSGEMPVRWRRNNNLNIPYIKSTVFIDQVNGDDLIQFGSNSDDYSPLSNEELLRIFDPLQASIAAQPNEIAAATAAIAASSEQTGATISTTPSADNTLKRSVSAKTSLPSSDEHSSSGRKQSSSLNVEQRTARRPSLSRLKTDDCLNELRLSDRKSDLEKQAQRLLTSIATAVRTDNYWNDAIIARRVSYPLSSVTSVMVLVHTDSEVAPVVRFTCDVGSSIDQLLGTVLYSLDKQQDQHDAYALKVFGFDEYLLPQSSLCDYMFVHNNIKLNQNIQLELVSAPLEGIGGINCDTFDGVINIYSDVERHTVELVLQTIQDQLRRIKTAIETGGYIQSTPAVQAVKALLALLHNIEPLIVRRAVERFVCACDSINDEKKKHQTERMTLSKNFDDISAESIQEIIGSVNMLLESVRQLLLGYCRSSVATFGLENWGEQEQETDLVSLEDSFWFYLDSVHNFPQEWLNNYAKIYASAYVFHGVRELHSLEHCAAAMKHSCLYTNLSFDSKITFKHSRLCVLPREARLCVVLYGIRIETNSSNSSNSSNPAVRVRILAWGSIPLFDSENYLRQDLFMVPMVANSKIEPWGSFSYIGELNQQSPVLTLKLPTFDFRVKFPETVAPSLRFSGTFEQLDVEMRQSLEDIIDNAITKELTMDEKDLLWEKRLYLIQKPEALPLVLTSSVSWDWLCLSNVYQMLQMWTPLEVAQAIQLLLPEFADHEVRQFALKSMQKCGTDVLLCYLPQIVEALQFEINEDSELAQMLLIFAKENKRFAFALFWQLEQRKAKTLYGCRCELLQAVLLHILGDNVETELKNQLYMVTQSDNIVTALKNARENERLMLLRSELATMDSSLLEVHVRLPLYPSVLAVGIDVAKSTYYNSYTLPVKVAYRSLNSCYEVLHKIGDDLRQDALVMQMVRLMNDIWLKEGLDLRMITFNCLPTGQRRGMIEVVLDSKTLREIHVEEGGVTGVFRDDLTQRWIQKHNVSELDYKMALKNFRLSCAGWCVATYILGIGDRHNDNILITFRGHVFHIDFGKYLGDSQMFGNIKRDRTPFILTSDLVYAINEGEAKMTVYFQEFVDNCCQAFNILRKHCRLFINLMKLMVCSGIPGLTIDAVDYISQNFWMECSDSKASERFTRMIIETMKNRFPKWNFFVHAMSQQRKPTIAMSNHQLLSFVPNTYTKETDGLIRAVYVEGCEKWHIPEKVYMYKLSVRREHVKFAHFIYRSYKEFVEFYEALYLRFPLIKLSGLSRSQSLGRTNIREVAERRKQEIIMFLQSLFVMTSEVTQCDLVYTFFHAILRDQETDGNREEPQIHHIGEIRGEIKLTLEYHHDELEIFVNHARNLPTAPGGAAPDVYVKCYLHPDNHHKTKRKTRIVSKSENPTFNETLTYKQPMMYFANKSLEVTVWRRDVLKENSFLGGVLIPLNELMNAPGRKFARWYHLQNVRGRKW